MSQRSAATLVLQPRSEAPALIFAVAVCGITAALAPLLDLPGWGRPLWLLGAWLPLIPVLRNYRAVAAIHCCVLDDDGGGRLTLMDGEAVSVRIVSWYAHPWLTLFVLRAGGDQRCWVVTAPRLLYPMHIHRRLRTLLRGSGGW